MFPLGDLGGHGDSSGVTSASVTLQTLFSTETQTQSAKASARSRARISTWDHSWGRGLSKDDF
eukprot:16133-Amphidinium_carterae.1